MLDQVGSWTSLSADGGDGSTSPDRVASATGSFAHGFVGKSEETR